MGGLIAKKMGLPVKKFVISTNSNDEVPEFLETGFYKSIVPSINCISSAMNVGHPSNLPRILELYNGRMNEKGEISQYPDLKEMRDDLLGIRVTDEETRNTISEIYTRHGILMEPHGAVAWSGLQEYLKLQNSHSESLAISLETAHPAKFPDEIQQLTNTDPVLPPSLEGLDDKNENYLTLDNSYEKLRELLLKN
jgi:threonine synthase